MSESLNKRVAKGVVWTTVETGAMYLVRFVIGVLLARLLTPADFGLIGMAAIFIAVSEVFVSAGFGQAYIYKDNATDKDANTVFFLNLAVSLVVYAVLFFAAPHIADFFNEPELKNITRVLFLCIIIDAFSIIQLSMLRKKLDFKRRAIARFAASVISGIAGVIFAYFGYGVWSLVIQQLASRFIMVVILYSTSTWRLTFSVSTSFAKESFAYSIWLLLSDLVTVIMNNFYRLVIAKFYSSKELGYYDNGERFKSMTSDTFVGIFTQVAFPSFSKVKGRPEELSKLCIKYVQYGVLVIYPLIITLLILAKPIVLCLLTEKWIAVIPYLKAFCLIGFVVPIQVFLYPLLEATGNTTMLFCSSIFRSLLRVVNVIVAIAFGNIIWILYGEFAVQSISMLLFAMLAKNKIGFNYLVVLKNIRLTFIVTLATALIGYILTLLISHFGNLAQILIGGTIMGGLYVLFVLYFQRNMIGSIKNLLLKKQE